MNKSYNTFFRIFEEKKKGVDLSNILDVPILLFEEQGPRGNCYTDLEAAKQYYADGKYTRAVVLLQDVISVLKGTDKGEESLYLLGISAYKARDYEAAANFLKKYYETYTNGLYTQDARFYNAMALYKNTPEPKLDQTETYEAVTAFQNLLEIFPQSIYAKESQDMIFKLQDKPVEKEGGI